ncbi:putative pectinesterase/pectinesterase inhibitor 36 [Termitomyces sp. J132]|nr:putative pectinesterase/pectinesterase inhibitor 36 [Termitomyces sp. J132]
MVFFRSHRTICSRDLAVTDSGGPDVRMLSGYTSLVALLHAACILSVGGLSPEFIACQIKKPAGHSPLLDCPQGTIYVSNNASDSFAHFNSIQEAILSLPPTGYATILIGEGEYHETINVTRTAPLTLMGQLPPSSLASVADPKYPLDVAPSSTSNLVQVFDTNFVHLGMDDATSAVLIIAPSFNASLIGAGPTGAPLQPLVGNSDFRAYNIDWSNRAVRQFCDLPSTSDGHLVFKCLILRMFLRQLSGHVTDYLFGFGTAWFQNVILANRACGGGIVAWKGTNLTDAPENQYGAYISESKIIRSPDANATTVTDGLCYLGRPWNDLATTVFLNTFMDQSIRPAGFTPFGGTRTTILNTTFYAEFNSSGSGGNTTARVPIEHILTAEEAQKFMLEKILGHPSWIDFEYRF